MREHLDRHRIGIHNPESGSARQAAKDLDELRENGVHVDLLETRFSDFDDNVKDLRDRIDEIAEGNDQIIAWGGDGSKNQLVNAWRGEFIFRAAGGFNDIPSAYHGNHRPLMDLVLSNETYDAYPLVVDVNDTHWRDVPGYTTLGWSAEAAGMFSRPDFRELVHRFPTAINLPARLGAVGVNYLKSGGSYLPAYRLNDGEVQETTTDILVPNINRIAGIVKVSGEPQKSEGLFRSTELDFSPLPKHVLKNVPFVARSAFRSMPAVWQQQMDIRFVESSDVPIHTDGEYKLLNDVDSISIRKSDQPFKVVK